METTEITPHRNVKHCGLCRQPNHNVRKCPQIDILDQRYLDRIQRFLLENDVFTIEGGIRYRFAWLQDRELIELRALSRKYNLAYKIMDKRDMYRALKRIYVEQSLRNIEEYYVTHSIQYYGHLYRTISLIEFLIHGIETNRNEQWRQAKLHYSFQSNEFEQIPDFECPICYESITQKSQKIQFNCSHTICNPCYKKMDETIHHNLTDWTVPTEMCMPKCPICRTTVHTLVGDLTTLHTSYNSTNTIERKN